MGDVPVDIRNAAKLSCMILVDQLKHALEDVAYNAHAADYFGVYTIKDRIKRPESIETKYPDKDWSSYSSLWALTSDFDAKLDDFIGIRIVVHSQFHKLRVVRAINNIIALGIPLENGLHLRSASELGTNGKNNWKYFNPPINYLYTSPSFIRAIDDKLRATLSSAVESSTGTNNSLTNIKRVIAENLSEVVSILKHMQIDIVRDGMGYASIQRDLVAEWSLLGNGADISQMPEKCVFELQVRTVLEDAWSEPEHKLAYKGSVGEDVRMLFANLGSNLSSCDDLLQIIFDRAESTQDRVYMPYNPFDRYYDMKFEKTHELFGSIDKAFVVDLQSIYRHRDAGRFGESLRILKLIKSKLKEIEKKISEEAIKPPILEVLQQCVAYIEMEEASQYFFAPGEPDAFEKAEKIYIYYMMSAMQTSKFWSHYRYSYLIIRRAQFKGIVIPSSVIEDALEYLNKAKKFKAAASRRLLEFFDISELDYDMALWEAQLLMWRARVSKTITNRQIQVHAAIEIVDMTLEKIKDESLKIQEGDMSCLRRFKTYKRALNMAIYYRCVLCGEGEVSSLKVKESSKRKKQLYDECVKQLCVFVDWSRKKKGNIALIGTEIDNIFLSCRSCVGDGRIKGMEGWDLGQVKWQDTLKALLQLALQVGEQKVTFCGETVIDSKNDLLRAITTMHDRQIAPRLMSLAIMGFAKYEMRFLDEYKLVMLDTERRSGVADGARRKSGKGAMSLD